MRFNVNCPICGKERSFSNKYTAQNAVDKGTKCYSCRTVELNKNRDVATVKNPAWKGYKDVPGKVLSKLMNGAKTRSIEFSITLEDISNVYESQGKKCALTGVDLDWSTNASVDRVDSNVGYVIDNIQIVTKQVNMLKKDMANHDFIMLCKAVADNCVGSKV